MPATATAPKGSGWPALDDALTLWAEENILDPSEFAALRAELEHSAGLLANVWDQRFTEAFYSSIEDALSKGQTFEEWLPIAQDVVARYGSDVTLWGSAEAGDLSDSYAELVFRQASASAYAAGRYARMFTSSRVQSDPFVMYSTVHDDRVREEHALLDGVVFRKNDAAARALFPPSDYNCRCFLIELDNTDLEDGGFDISFGADFEPPPDEFNRDRVLELVPHSLRGAASNGD